MRRLVVIALALSALAGATAAGAAVRDEGDGTLSVRNADGTVWIKATGAVVGRIDSGTIRVFDPADGDPLDVNVWGDYGTPQKVPFRTTVYSGDDIRFRIVGRFRIRVIGTGINLSAVGQGKVGMQGDAGTYSFNGKLPRKPLPPDLDDNGNLILFDLGDTPNPGPGP